MTSGPPAAAPQRDTANPQAPQAPRPTSRAKVLGALAAVTIPAIVYTQWNLYGDFGRDSAIYLYGGQQVTHGVPPYASIMDPKGPIPGILCGFGVAVARLLGRNDVLVVRAEFCALSILTVLGVYLLVLELWRSVVGGVVAAAVFTAFKMFAYDALNGPDGHTPGILFLVFAMWLTARRRWYLAGVAASLAAFSWQPLVPYAAVSLLCAVLWSPGRRLRAAQWSIAGIATPLLALVAYYAACGYSGKLWEGVLIFPLEGGYRPPMSFGTRVSLIAHNIPHAFGASALLIFAGLALLVALTIREVVTSRRAALRTPVVLLLMVTLLFQVAYIFYDYIGWTHAFPLLPYAAVGIGGATAVAVQRLSDPAWRARVGAGALVAAAALTVVSAIGYHQPSDATDLREEQASSCAIQRGLVRHTTVWSIDNPVPLVLLHRRNPDNYAFVGGGLAQWKIDHLPGGFDAWMADIRTKASIVAFQYWSEDIPIKAEIQDWLLTHGYRSGYIGKWSVYVNARAYARLQRFSIRVTRKTQDWPLLTNGGTYQVTHCPRHPRG